MAEPETIEAEVEEQLTQALEPYQAPPPTLFRTDDPAEVVRKAAATATVLKQVLVDQKLITKIGNREHVNAEGWTLLGSMLGVFPVPVWTRRLEHEDGWEARVEARTISGAVVGAGDAQCTRAEKEWGFSPSRGTPKDDFALRSMAQTRAVSKALKLPLGFIVKMAGFEATPAEEMPLEGSERRVEGPGDYPVPKSWAKVKEAVTATGTLPAEQTWPMFEAFVRAASYHLYGQTDSKKITADERKIMLQKAGTAALYLVNLPPEGPMALQDYTEEKMRAAWASVLDGQALEIPDYTPPDVSDVDPEIARMAEETITG